MINYNKLTLFSLFFIQSIAFAAPDTLNFQAFIKKPDGLPLQESSVNFTIKYKNPAGNCTIFSEDFNNVSMVSSNGNLSLQLGSGTQTFPAINTGVTLAKTFSNNPTAAFNCVEGGTFSPAESSHRVLSVEFSYAGMSLQKLDNIEINSVPFSMHASESQNALKLAGVAASLYTKFADFETCTGGKFLTYDGQYFTCENATVTGFSGSLSGDVSGSQSSTSVTKIRGTPVSATAPTTGQYLKFDGTNWVPQTLSLTSGTVTAIDSANAYLTVTNPNSTPTLTLNVGTAANTVAAGDDSRITGAFQSSSTLSGDLSGTLPSPSVATVGSKTAAQVAASVNDTSGATSAATASTLVKRDSSGNAAFSTTSATNFSGRNFWFYEPTDSFKVTLAASNSLATNYTLTLPTTAGNTGQILSTNGSGVTSWITPNAGTVTGVTGTAPVTVGGTAAAPVISMAAATGSVNGYLTSANWTTFNNKLGTTTAHAGDVSGTYNALSVDRIKGTTVSISSLTNGNFLKYNGATWVNLTPTISDITNLASTLSSKLDQSQMPAMCGASETLNYTSVTDTWMCTAISVDGSQITGVIDSSKLYGGTYSYTDGSVPYSDTGKIKSHGRNSERIHYTDVDARNNGQVVLPGFNEVDYGWQITISRESGSRLLIITSNGELIRNNTNKIDMTGLNLASVTIAKTKTSLGDQWYISNEVRDCEVGLACGHENNIYIGTLNGYQYFTTPGNCDDKNSCDNTEDSYTARWADGSGNSASNVLIGANFSNDGLPQSTSMATSYDDTFAAKFCEDMDLNKIDDWYLPTVAEFDLLLQNKGKIPGFLTHFDSANEYWTSLESDTTNAIMYIQSNFNYINRVKTDRAKIRCVRRI